MFQTYFDVIFLASLGKHKYPNLTPLASTITASHPGGTTAAVSPMVAQSQRLSAAAVPARPFGCSVGVGRPLAAPGRPGSLGPRYRVFTARLKVGSSSSVGQTGMTSPELRAQGQPQSTRSSAPPKTTAPALTLWNGDST